jgi:hypothetical protein
MRERALFLILLGINFLVLLLEIKGLSISYNEAKIIYSDHLSFLGSLITSSLHIFGQNDYALRLPMIGLHLLSVVLLYSISKHYVSRSSDRLWIVLIYVLLPGVTSAALVVDNAGLIITLLFLFVYLYIRFERYALILLPFMILVDPSFVYLFFGLILFGIYRKDYVSSFIGFIALVISLYVYGIHIGGLPESRFLDVLGVYNAIFSPIVFIYLFYVLYRRMIAREWDVIWMISMSAFIVSLLLSFRQKVEVQSFAPYLLIALPLAAQTFFHTYRVRLREFRKRYRFLFYSAFTLLIANALAVFFNHYLYHFLSNPMRHFSYPMHIAKELSHQLHKNNIHCVDAENDKLQLRLRFYGITQCENYRLSEKAARGSKKVTISYTGKPIYFIYVTKIHK